MSQFIIILGAPIVTTIGITAGSLFTYAEKLSFPRQTFTTNNELIGLGAVTTMTLLGLFGFIHTYDVYKNAKVIKRYTRCSDDTADKYSHLPHVISIAMILGGWGLICAFGGSKISYVDLIFKKALYSL